MMHEKMFYTIQHHIQYIHQFYSGLDLRTIHTPTQVNTKIRNTKYII